MMAFFLAEQHDAVDELRGLAAKAGGLLAMVDGDAHDAPGTLGDFTGARAWVKP